MGDHYKKRYEILKKEKRCTICKEQDEMTLSGRVRCEKCQEFYKKRYYKGKGADQKDCRNERIKVLKSKASKKTIYEIVRLAEEAHMSYGKYVAEHM